jgi:hypothetical protein
MSESSGRDSHEAASCRIGHSRPQLPQQSKGQRYPVFDVTEAVCLQGGVSNCIAADQASQPA